MPIAFGRRQQLTRSGAFGIVVEGEDVVVAMFTRESLVAPAKGAAVVVKHAGQAANTMRATVPVGERGAVLNSITSDRAATIEAGSVYADAGPDSDEDSQAFVARFLEHGTVRMSPQPFVGPAADAQEAAFLRDCKGIPGL